MTARRHNDGSYVADSICPHCGAIQQGHAPWPDDLGAPKDGDVSVCAQCAKPALFEDGQPRLPTAEELAELLADDDIRRTIAASADWKRT